MAIGSDAEIGVQFGRWGDMDEPLRQRWFRYVQEVWGPNLLNGYASVVYVDQQKREYYNATPLLSVPEVQ